MELGVGARAESEPDFAFFSRSRSANLKKKLGVGVEPESGFKVVFEVVMIVGGRMSHYLCFLEMEYQNTGM